MIVLTTYLDFKSGKESLNKDKLKGTVRQYVAAFANGDGGILCVGPADARDPTTGQRPLEPLSPPSPQTDLVSWTRDILADLTPYLSPLPRIRLETYSGGAAPGEMLLIAVARAPGLVPLYGKDKRPTWWVRFHDSNRELPDYLAADVILGRRNQPVLELRAGEKLGVNVPSISGNTDGMLERYGQISVAVMVENMGFVPAQGVIAGIIAWSLERPEPASEPNDHLRQYLDLADPAGAFSGGGWQPLRLRNCASNYRAPDGADLQAWQTAQLYLRKVAVRDDILNSHINVPVAKGGATEVSAAVYLLAAGCQPQWYQLSFRLKESGKPHYECQHEEIVLKRLYSERPLAAFRRVP